MAKTYLPYDPDQTLLMPPSLNDWLPDDHLARYVNDLIDTLDLTLIYEEYEDEERGAPPYHPAMMTKVLVYGYCIGVRSSRTIEQAIQDQVAFRFLSAGNQPSYWTINNFRAIHLEALEDLFKQVIQMAANNDLVRLGTVSIDGCKIQANAALERNRTHKELVKQDKDLTKLARDILADAERIDREEDELYGPGNTPYGLPAELSDAKTRRAKIRKALEDMKQANEARYATEKAEHDEHIAERQRTEKETGKKLRGRKPKPPTKRIDPETKRNLTDKDSRIMKTRTGYVQGYNAQAAVDTDSLLIVGRSLTNQENDTQQCIPMLESVRDVTGRYPHKGVLDAGYWNEPELRSAPSEVDLYVATTKDWKQRKTLQDAPPPRGRIPKDATYRDRMERKLLTKSGRATYKKRGKTVEPRFGIIREGMGIRRFLLRGIKKVAGEWNLLCLGHNVSRLRRIGMVPA
jgi:transposase